MGKNQMNWTEVAVIKPFTDGRFCQKWASYIRHITEWRKKGASFFETPTEVNQEKEQAENLVCIV